MYTSKGNISRAYSQTLYLILTQRESIKKTQECPVPNQGVQAIPKDGKWYIKAINIRFIYYGVMYDNL